MPDDALPFREFLKAPALADLLSPDDALSFGEFLTEPALADLLPPDDVLSFREFRMVTITILNLLVYKSLLGERLKKARTFD
jgi:hypothetical protein